MENKLSISKGAWWACCKKATPHFVFAGEEGTTICAMLKEDDFGHLIPIQEVVDNAKLIEDAGNTYHKCGMLPSELLKCVEDLKKLLEEKQS